MTIFLDLPPELRLNIYDEIILGCTWSRTVDAACAFALMESHATTKAEIVGILSNSKSKSWRVSDRSYISTLAGFSTMTRFLEWLEMDLTIADATAEADSLE